jgi:hypothetical protein
MSLPTCPSCGQSVLEDDAVDCPFCGAAMDGSRGAKNTPRPKANPVANRPGARKVPPPAAPAAASSAKSEAPAPVSRPASAARSGAKPKVDEDDPFGMGVSGRVDAIQATVKPEKGRLFKVTCPMCEQVGFVPRNAVGKSVRCANEKCMVPIFTALDPSEQAADRKPTRMSDESEAARRLAEAGQPVRRNPLKLYLIVAGVGLAAALGLVAVLNRRPNNPDLQAPIPTIATDDGLDPEEEDRRRREAQAARDAVEKGKDPRVEVAALTKRMITLARGNVRDKSLARSMTGDLYLRLGEKTLAAQELNQLGNVEGSRPFYRMGPHLNAYWRTVGSDPTAAQNSLQSALAEQPSLSRSGRAAAEAALGLAAALINESRMSEAVPLVASRQLDRTTPANRDTMAGTAWICISGRCRDAGLDPPAVLDAWRWADPYSVAVAADLAIHDRWNAAVDWSKSHAEPRASADALVLIADLAHLRKAGADVLQVIESAAPAGDGTQALRVRAAVASAAGDAARLAPLMTALQSMTAAAPVPLPGSTELVQQEVPDRQASLERAATIAEVVRAAVVLGQSAEALAGLDQFEAELMSAAPPTAALREMSASMSGNEPAYKRKIASEMRVSDENQFASMFRGYRRHLEQLTTAAEDRRLCQLVLLSRIIRSGGAASVDAWISANPARKSEFMLDEMCGLVSASVRMTGADLSVALTPDGSLFRGRAAWGDAKPAVLVGAAAELAWAGRDQDLTGGMGLLSETGITDSWPAMREALAIELIGAQSQRADAAVLLTGLLGVRHESWREELLAVAARGLTARGQEKAVESWLSGQKLKPLEQISLCYGMSVALLDRLIPAAETQSAPEGSSATADGQ